MLYAKCAVAALFVLAVLASCSQENSNRYSITQSKAYEASLFRQNCAVCHGPEGEGKTLEDSKQIPNLRDGEHKFNTEAEIYKHISDGGNGMIPFRDQLTEREIRMMVDFVRHRLRKN